MLRTRDLAEGSRISALSTILMTFIGLFELIVGLVTGSFGLIGDGVDSFADASTSLVVWVGLRISKRKPDNTFHFGYLRAETLYSMFGAIIIAGVGLVIMYQSYSSLFTVRDLQYGTFGIATALIATVISSAVLVYKIKKSRSLQLLSLKTEVVNSATDSLSSIAAFVGLTLADRFGIIQFDSAVGLIIGVFVLISSYMIIRESSLVLMDACSCHGVRDELEILIKNIPGVKAVNSIRLRRSGSYIVGDITVIVDGTMSVEETQRISKQLDERAKNLFDEIHEIVIKFEPSEPER